MLQSQIEPHFLFNTLANVQALVESGSPRAAPVLGSLIAYLRAAMPKLHDGAPTLGQEESLVRAYLELMQIRMPDRLAYGIDVDPTLRSMLGCAQIVFVTVFEEYAVTAFEQGAIDYLVKPFDEARLEATVQRLKQRLAPRHDSVAPDASLSAALAQLSSELQARGPARRWLQWIKASVGTTLRLILVEQVAFMRSDEKYTLVVWDGGEALIRKTTRELADELDPERFAQIHRSVIVNLSRVEQVSRGVNETADVHVKGRSEVLPVSRSYVHLFRQM